MGIVLTYGAQMPIIKVCFFSIVVFPYDFLVNCLDDGMLLLEFYRIIYDSLRTFLLSLSSVIWKFFIFSCQ